MKTSILFIFLVVSNLHLLGIINLEHSPPPGRNFRKFILTIDQFQEIKEVYFYYRETGELNYSKLEKFSASEPDIVFHLPRNVEISSGLEYYFEVQTKNNEFFTLPQQQASVNPFRISISPSNVKVEENFILLSPDTSFLEKEKLVIAISYFAIANKVEQESINLYVNGKVRKAEISKNMLVYVVPNPKPTNYIFWVTAKIAGRKIRSSKWEHRVEKKMFPYNLRAKASLKTFLNSENRERGAETELQTDLRLNLQANRSWWKASSNIFLSSRENSNSQPVNRYNLKFSYPYGKIILGDNLLQNNNFATSGKYIRGVSHVLHVNKLKIYTSYGSIQRAIEGTSYSNTESDYTVSTFRRNTLQLRTEVGNNHSFLWGLEIVKNKDIINSLAEEYYLQADSSYSVTPKDNLVLATDARIAFFKQRLVWEAEAAMSFYNSNIFGGAISIDSLEAEFDQDIDIPIDPISWENIFVINKNIEPIIPGWSNLAFKTNLRAFIHRNLLTFSYSAVGGSFYSLASSSVQKDAQIFSVNDNLNLWNNRINIMLGFSLFSDNVYDYKTCTTSSNSYYSQLYYQPNNLPTLKMGINISDSENNNEQFPYESILYDYSMGMSYDYQPWEAKINLDYNFYDSQNEYNTFSQENEAIHKNEIIKNRISLSIHKQLAKSRVTAGYSITLNHNPSFVNYVNRDRKWLKLADASYNYNSFYVKNRWDLLHEKFKPYVNLRLSNYNGEIDSQTAVSASGGTKYILNESASLDWHNRVYVFSNYDDSCENWQEFETSLKINYNF